MQMDMGHPSCSSSWHFGLGTWVRWVLAHCGAGHFSASVRYTKLRERAFDYAWLLEQLGKAE